MNAKKKLVFISNMASPYQVKFCYALQDYFDAEFWFHVYLEGNRPAWWKVDLGEKCKILENVLFKRNRKYLALSIFRKLNEFDPDIVLIGGFSHPTNYLAYRWAKYRKRKVVLLRETYRKKSSDGIDKLKRKGIFTGIVKFLYRKSDLIFALSEDARIQMVEEFGFPSSIVVTAQYPTDLDSQLLHSLRRQKENKDYVILFANRLIDNYSPCLAIEIFGDVLKKYPSCKLLMNNDGPLKDTCIDLIEKLGIKDSVTFLDKIRSWDDLHRVYEDSDILLFPASFSNGNLTILEAMASGAGIIISDKVLGVGKLVENDVNGFVCCLDKLKYVESVTRYFSSPVLFENHGKLNKKIASPFSIKSTAKLYYDLLNPLI